MTNKHRKVWKVVFRKPLSGKQTQPQYGSLGEFRNQLTLYLAHADVKEKSTWI